jgi:hypothetical protein
MVHLEIAAGQLDPSALRRLFSQPILLDPTVASIPGTPLPVVVTPVLTFSFGATGDLPGTVQASLDAQGTVSATAHCAASVCSVTPAISATFPKHVALLGGAVNLTLSLDAVLSFSIDGLPGPLVNTDAALAVSNNSPPATFTGIFGGQIDLPPGPLEVEAHPLAYSQSFALSGLATGTAP